MVRGGTAQANRPTRDAGSSQQAIPDLVKYTGQLYSDGPAYETRVYAPPS